MAQLYQFLVLVSILSRTDKTHDFPKDFVGFEEVGVAALMVGVMNAPGWHTCEFDKVAVAMQAGGQQPRQRQDHLEHVLTIPNLGISVKSAKIVRSIGWT